MTSVAVWPRSIVVSPQPPRALEPDRQPGGDGDRAAAVESDGVVGRRPVARTGV